MAIIPENKQWTQTNDGDSFGVINSSWGIDLEENNGSVGVSNPLKNVIDETDFTDLNRPVAQYVEFMSKLFAVSSEIFKASTLSTSDITDTSKWTQDGAVTSPSPTATQTDAVVFDNLILVSDGNDIWSNDGGVDWTSWWKGTLSQASLSTSEKMVLKIGADGNLYIVDAGNLVYRVDKDGSTVTKTGEGTLDFSATDLTIINGVTTSTRLFYGTEDNAGDNCAIIEWDMGPQSISANKVHQMGTKRVLVIAEWNDLPIAILSDGSIKYHNGSAFVDWEGAKLPDTKHPYADDVIHKNGWDIIDGLPHFLINPSVDLGALNEVEDSSNYWNYPAGVYCLDPKKGLYCRYPLSDGTNQHFMVSSVGALKALTHKNTKFFASYDVWTDATDTNNYVISAAEDSANEIASTAHLLLQPMESVSEVIKKLTLIHKRLGIGDEINVFYRRYDNDSIKLSGNWLDSTTFNTTDDTTGLENGWYGFNKLGAHFLSKVTAISGGNTKSITFADEATITANDTAVIEFVNFKSMGSVKGGVEMSELTIPNSVKSRQVWIWIELKQAAGNNIQLDYLLTE